MFGIVNFWEILHVIILKRAVVTFFIFQIIIQKYFLTHFQQLLFTYPYIFSVNDKLSIIFNLCGHKAVFVFSHIVRQNIYRLKSAVTHIYRLPICHTNIQRSVNTRSKMIGRCPIALASDWLILYVAYL